ncbi:MAG: T9SS type A sorting domain-containing protein [Alcanivoracaceae bacterium]|nr:T9SS type A sorting domain-containing protein [Alcanivoracaceae bacterium]
MKKIIWCAAMLIVGSVSNAQTTIELSPEKDNSICSESENSNGLGKLFVGQTCTDNSRRALLEFDIAAMVPFGATITDVSLTLNMDNVSPDAGTQDYSLHRVGLEWGEGASDGGGEGATAEAPDATWADAMFETSEWDDLGGDYYTVASATSAIGEALIDYTWSAPGMIPNVQNWLDYPSSNHGWILIGDEGLTCTARRFGSKDDGTAPVLEVTYTCADGPAVARCHALIIYLDDAGEATITAEDVDAGSAVPCDGELTLTVSPTSFTCEDIIEVEVVPSMIISGVFDCTITGGTPKGVEVYVINDIADLSAYGIGFANNGGGTDGEEFTFPAVSASAGTYFYISTEILKFSQWFGFDPSYTDGAAAINGDDAIELFYEDAVIDIFGDIDVDGSGQPWEYLDGWAYRISDTGLDGDAFDISHWTFSGPNALDGEASNATAEFPMPVGTYSTDPEVGLFVTLIASGDIGDDDTCYASIIVLDTLAPVMSCVAAITYVLDETGVMVIDPTDLDAGTEDGCGIDEMSISMDTFTCENDGDNDVWLFATDIYGNMDSCMVVVTIDASEVISVIEDELIDPTCFGFEDGQININVTGGTPDYMFDWDADGTGDFDDFEDIAALGEGTYEVVVVDENGCQATATFELTQPEELTATVEVVNETCPGAGDGSVTFTYSGGTPPYTGPEEITGLSAGDYTEPFVDAQGCSYIIDYVIGLETTIDLTVTETGVDLTSNEAGASYQWVNCPDYDVIDGAIDQTYVPVVAGEYAVIVTIDGGCSDTTACFMFDFESIDEFNKLSVVLFPNPTNGIVNVKMGALNEQPTITVFDMKGSVVYQKSAINSNEKIDLKALENGIYFIQVATDNAVITKKITLSK